MAFIAAPILREHASFRAPRSHNPMLFFPSDRQLGQESSKSAYVLTTMMPVKLTFSIILSRIIPISLLLIKPLMGSIWGFRWCAPESGGCSTRSRGPYLRLPVRLMQFGRH